MEKTIPFPSVVAICVELVPGEALVIFTLPVPFGAKVMSPFAPSVILMVPELVPLLVLSVRSPEPCVVIVAFVSFSPTVKLPATCKESLS
mgnify:CR=1 FL=1